MSLHRITWSSGAPQFHCDGDATSPCHNFPDCECEYFNEEHNELHPSVPHDVECWILPWLTNIEVEYTWEDGDGHSLPPEVDAEITTSWDGDQVLWNFADLSLAEREQVG